MLNRVTLLGRLTADPELKTTNAGTSVCSFDIAVQRDKDHTDFLTIVTWRQTAEIVAKYFSKGRLIAVDGSLQSRTYTDKNGKNQKVVEVVAQSVSFCDSKKEEKPEPAYDPAYDYPTDDLPF